MINWKELTGTVPSHNTEPFDTTSICELDCMDEVDYNNLIWELQDEANNSDETQWLLAEIEKTKLTDLNSNVKQYLTLTEWVNKCNKHNLLAEVARLVKEYLPTSDSLSVAMNNAMYDWDI